MAFTAYDPRTGHRVGPEFIDASPADVGAAVTDAVAASTTLATSPPAARMAALESIAAGLEALGEDLVQLADEETALGAERLRSERARTCAQLRAFARMLEDGAHLDVIVDGGDAHAVPARPDLRRMAVPLGPVAVFAASNFPLAFSVPGGDTASALAAGCPVIVKAHPSHPQTSQRCAEVIHDAVLSAGLPAGCFSLLQGSSTNVGAQLVREVGVAAVAFTGSVAGGRALFDIATARPVPIPVFAEMGSTNPVFVTGRAAAARGPAIAQALVDSVLVGNGQFCTKPGLIFAVRESEAFVDEIATRLGEHTSSPMLNARIALQFEQHVTATRRTDGVTQAAATESVGSGFTATGRAFVTDLGTVRQHPELMHEMFGPATVVVVCRSDEQLVEAAAEGNGALVASVYAEDDDLHARPLLSALTRRVGRIVWNGVPTGVAVSPAMVHGGPYPATTDAAHTSVGATAIRRFLRPVCFQDVPRALLPPALQDPGSVTGAP